MFNSENIKKPDPRSLSLFGSGFVIAGFSWLNLLNVMSRNSAKGRKWKKFKINVKYLSFCVIYKCTDFYCELSNLMNIEKYVQCVIIMEDYLCCLKM